MLDMDDFHTPVLIRVIRVIVLIRASVIVLIRASVIT
jgi:hypothetical protein